MLIAITVAVSGCSLSGADDGASPAGAASVFPDSVVAPLADALPQRTVTPLPPARLADGLLPPTNRWFSGMVFGADPMPVFPLPLSFRLTDTGFEFGLPNVSSEPKVVLGGFVGDVAVDTGADSHEVTAYDEASVTIEQRSGSVLLGSTVIAQGSPLVSFTAAGDVDLRFRTPFRPSDDGVFLVEVAGSEYGLVTGGDVSGDGSAVSLAEGDVATWFALPDAPRSDTALAALVEAARHPIAGTSLEYSLDGDRAGTGIRYRTSDDAPTVIARMPHHGGAACDGGAELDGDAYSSVYGQLALCVTSALTWTVPRLEPTGSLDFADLDGDDRARLREQVAADIAATDTFAADTYFGGKSFYRAANLLDIARQVGADAAAADMEARLVDAITEWSDPGGCFEGSERCFVYDPAARGVVGLATSFGSDEFNDHHFHYGYFLYAAGVVAADDPELAARWAPVMDLLAADIATGAEGSYFPERRVFDAYAGHS